MFAKVIAIVAVIVVTVLLNAQAQEKPFHTSVICQEKRGKVGCEDAMLRKVFQQHMDNGGAEKGESTFTLWNVGASPQHLKPYLTICTPKTWGTAAVQAKKLQFLSSVRSLLASTVSLSPGVFPPGCTPPHTVDPATSLVVLHTDLAIREISYPFLKQPVTEPPHVSVVCDQSGSTKACTLDSLLGAYDHWLRARHFPGGTFRLYVPTAVLETQSFLFQVVVPDLAPAHRTAYLLAAREELVRAYHKATNTSSAILQTISLAMHEMVESPSTGDTLIILSDLREMSITPQTTSPLPPKATSNPAIQKRGKQTKTVAVTPVSTAPLSPTPYFNFNFESRSGIVSPDVFKKTVRDLQLFPPLNGMRILVCGVHDRRMSGDVTNADVLKIEALFRAGFLDAGLQKDNLQMVGRCETVFPKH